MTFDIVPNTLFPFANRFPAFFDDDDDLRTFANTGSGLSIGEDDKQVYIEAALPGLTPDDIDITFEKGVVWIKGEAKEEETKKKYYRKAISSFSYRVHVPGNIDPTKEPTAQYKNGVMHITFAKSPTEQPKKIAISKE